MTDIYSIERKLDAVIDFLENRLDSTTTLYEPTKHRFESWIEKFNTAIQLTSRIIQEDELQDEQEFENTSSVSVEQIFDSLYQLADRYESLLGQTNPNSTKQATQKLTLEDKKEVISQYRDCINFLVKSVDISNISYLRECAYTLKQWFDARYKIGETDFKYDVKTLPSWIVGIVITYSKHILTGTTQDFVLDFSEWIDNVDENAMYSTYPVPYNIYMNTKNVCVDDSALTSMVLWDLLFDSGFYRLHTCKVPLNKDTMNEVYKNSKNIVDMSNVQSYKYYKDNESILQESNLLITEVDGNE